MFIYSIRSLLGCFLTSPLVCAFLFIYATEQILVTASESTSPSPPSAIVNLRIEGAFHTIYEAPIFTTPHNVTTALGGTHPCNGLNYGANPFPGPTCTSALDDAARSAGFTWDGPFYDTYDDYFITRIAHSAANANTSWGILLNFAFTPVGGCQQEVGTGAHVLFAYDAFNAAHFLALTVDGSSTVHAGEPVTLVVTDGMTGYPLEGAKVYAESGGEELVTDGTGKVTFTFKDPSVVVFKAEQTGSIRSNRAKVTITS
ncbi:uncharacterized protein FIBRA_03913 [Fibroporia radiculosa]|uniref:Uncharacterized protein n=1 Tax=Fibroporia radiculosa TaxID=599839 RepID=J4G6J4_9APHY|nr:uncharacterized protein FIBRA_03913 [Fibroporia radiculosa]CCM01843.1 predicted protein [Fibroporia radiculosa]